MIREEKLKLSICWKEEEDPEMKRDQSVSWRDSSTQLAFPRCTQIASLCRRKTVSLGSSK